MDIMKAVIADIEDRDHKRFVVNVPGAVGFIPLTDVDTTVKSVSIDGQTAGAAGYVLTVPTDLEQ